MTREEFENLLADYARGELPPAQTAAMREYTLSEPGAGEALEAIKQVLLLAREVAREAPPEDLLAEAARELFGSLGRPAECERMGQRLYAMRVQFQGSYGHGETCLATLAPPGTEVATQVRAFFQVTAVQGQESPSTGLLPRLRIQVQGSWGHGEACLPASADVTYR